MQLDKRTDNADPDNTPEPYSRGLYENDKFSITKRDISGAKLERLNCIFLNHGTIYVETTEI